MMNLCSLYVCLVLLQLLHVAICATVINNTGAVHGIHDTKSKQQISVKDNPSRVLSTRLKISRNRQHENNQSQFPEDLGGKYKYLTYRPVDSRLDIGGKTPPPLPEHGSKQTHNIKKRMSFDVGLAFPACPFTTEWKILRLAMDDNNTMVEVFQPGENSNIYSNRYQWFYTVTCDFTIRRRSGGNTCINCCNGIDERKSHERRSLECDLREYPTNEN